MTRRAAENGDGKGPLLPFKKPEATEAIPAKTEIKKATLARARAYAEWASSFDPEAKITLADVIELALEEAFRRDKNFQKHEATPAGCGGSAQTPPAPRSARTAAPAGASSDSK